MNSGTRVSRGTPSLNPFRSTDGTAVHSWRSPRASERRTPQALFLERQRVMASAVAEERRPGLFVFAAHEQFGHIGRLWLQASEAPRSGILGRHDCSDLALPLDDELSLRHLMFVVRRVGDAVHFCAVDLASTGGLSLESGNKARLVEGTTALFLQVSDFTLFCVPTGVGPQWDRDHEDPWSTMADRAPLRVEWLTATSERGLAATVELEAKGVVRRVNLSHRALSRGVLIGRADRCDLMLDDALVSRVHLALLELGGEFFLFDAGSTNGVFTADGEEVRTCRLESGAEFHFGDGVVLRLTRTH